MECHRHRDVDSVDDAVVLETIRIRSETRHYPPYSHHRRRRRSHVAIPLRRHSNSIHHHHHLEPFPPDPPFSISFLKMTWTMEYSDSPYYS